MRISLSVIAAVAARELRVAARYPVSVANLLVLVPLYQLVLPALLLGAAFLVAGRAIGLAGLTGTADLAGWLTIGMAFSALIVGVTWGVANAIETDRELGTIEHSWAAPVSRDSLLLGSITSSTLLAAVAALIMFAMGWLIFGASYGAGLLLIPLAAALALPGVAGLGYLVAALVLRWRHAGEVVDSLGYVLAMLAGVAFPVSVLPSALQAVAYAIPVTWAIDISRATALGATPIRPAPVEIGLLVVTSAAWLLAGRWQFLRVERRLLADGTLGQH
ncbi:ABC transporter permease [Sphaerisporangium viridialbum]|uniref:ABC transporter permease n=1 Tax=Sphaerisporangium viridialbum TaxID=46189 RepID=UPI003C788C30